MKKLTNLVLNLSVMISITLIFGTESIHAQCNFIPAVKVETPIGPNNTLAGTVQNTGNDSRTGINVSGSMTVHVWDGSSPGFGWDDGTNNGFVNLPSGTFDPDVALVEVQSPNQSSNYTWYAVVVYANGSNFCKCKVFEWDLTNLDFPSPPTDIPLYSGTSSSLGQYISAINIDADANGDFVIVWDDPTSTYPDIQVTGGNPSTLSTNPPTLCNTYASRLDNTVGSANETFFSPDVSVYWDYPNLASVVNYTYLSFRINGGSNYSHIFESNNDFNTDICSGAYPAPSYLNYTNVLSSPSDYYGRPRIACPAYGNGTLNTDWSVAVMRVTSGGADIVNYTDYGGSIQAPHVYTDNSLINTCGQISGLDPAISYDANYSGMIVGWNTNYSGASNYNQNSMVVASCQTDGRINSSCYSGSVIDYMVVPSDNLTYNNANHVYSQVHLSISGRDNTDMIYTFYDYIWRTGVSIVVEVDQVMFKPVDYCDQNNFSLRHSKDNNFGNAIVFPNPFEDQLKINLLSDELINEDLIVKLYDVSGNLLFDSIGKEEQINNELEKILNKLSKGIYLIKIEIESQGEILNKKLVKM